MNKLGRKVSVLMSGYYSEKFVSGIIRHEHKTKEIRQFWKTIKSES